MSAVATARGVTCPYCREALEPEAPTSTCERCQTALHPDCAALHGRCTTFGCQGRADELTALPPPPSRRARPRVAHRRRPALLTRLLRPRDDGALLAAAVLGAVWVLARAL